MAMKFITCTLRPSSLSHADEVMELWIECEQGESDAAVLVHQIDKIECMSQAMIYEQRLGIDMSEFMALKEQVTLPYLKNCVELRIQSYSEAKARKDGDYVVVFVSGTAPPPVA